MNICEFARFDKDKLIATMKREYLTDEQNYPWIVGYSGGKDSTLVVHLVFDMLMEVSPRKRKRQVHIISNDTLVESPLVIGHLYNSVEKLKEAVTNFGLPITVNIVYPEVDQSFWTLLIGKGYPSPNMSMRWCTDRLKIKPTSGYIHQQVSKAGAAIVVLGVRRDESQTRRRSIDKHESEDTLAVHPSLTGAYIYSPIVDLTTEEVWEFLWQNDPVWGGTHEELIAIYKKAEGGECPIVLGKEDAPGCGTNSSRFGCWVCTVVQKDKSLQAVVDGGEEKYIPLIEFRDWLLSIRNDPSYRSAKRRNGKITFSSTGSHIPGPFTIKARKMILDRLLDTQDEFGQQLISRQEIDIIHKFWTKDMIGDRDEQ